MIPLLASPDRYLHPLSRIGKRVILLRKVGNLTSVFDPGGLNPGPSMDPFPGKALLHLTFIYRVH